MRVDLCYDVRGWAYHRRCLAIAKYAPDWADVLVGAGRGRRSQREADLAFQLLPNQIDALKVAYRRAKCRVPRIIGAVNTGFSSRAAAQIRSILERADYCVVNNRDCWEKTGRLLRTRQISNGVDLEQFKATMAAADRRPRVLWVGSAAHREHKGYDEFVVPIFRRLWRDGIETKVILANSHGGPTRLSLEQLIEEYNRATVLLVASRSEGTPNPALEASACGCIIASTWVGNMPELIVDGENGRLAARNLGALESAVRDCLDGYLQMQPKMAAAIRSWDWSVRARQYWDLFSRYR